MSRQVQDTSVTRFKILLTRLHHPAALNDHPLAQPSFLAELTRGMDAHGFLAQDEPNAGWRFYVALRIVVRDLLHQHLTPESQAGLLIVWIYDLLPISKGVKPDSLPETLQAYLAKREHLVRVLYETDLIRNSTNLNAEEEEQYALLRAQLSGLSPRNASKRREKALTAILRRFERAANGLGIDLFAALAPNAKSRVAQRASPNPSEDKFEARASEGTEVPTELVAVPTLAKQSERDKAAPTLLDAPHVAMDMPAAIHQVEPERIEQELAIDDEQPAVAVAQLTLDTAPTTMAEEQPASAAVPTVVVEPPQEIIEPRDWHQIYLQSVAARPLLQIAHENLPADFFIPRQIHTPNESVIHALPRVAGLATKWVVLCGERGSGRTTALHWLARNSDELVAIVLDAKRYAEIVPFWLVDDLFVLPSDERKWVIRGLQRVKGNIVLTAPALLVPGTLQEITKGDHIEFELVPLNDNDIESYIVRYQQFYGDAFDALLCRRVCREVPDLAQSALGLAVICEQVHLQQSDCASIIARFINELYARSGLTAPQWQGMIESPSAEVSALWYGALDVANSFGWKFRELPPLAFIRANATDEETRIYDTCPLLTRIEPRKVWQFLNTAVVAFLTAHSDLRGGLLHYLSRNPKQDL
ncbi:MAG TPA: hypothetical protein VFD70_21295, partial [Anaerolineae bacterium]|nr:hypothetical protein [Anaerolineae bacterium]